MIKEKINMNIRQKNEYFSYLKSKFDYDSND
jgi:hypothetical protein